MSCAQAMSQVAFSELVEWCEYKKMQDDMASGKPMLPSHDTRTDAEIALANKGILLRGLGVKRNG